MRPSIPSDTGSTVYIFEHGSHPAKLPAGDRVYITDTNVHNLYPDIFKGRSTIILRPGEEHKTQDSVEYIIEQLLQFEAHRKTTVVGIGGGLITDITGYAASIYMRGIPFSFIPTTLLGMVDAAVGGKNGVNHRLQKNLIGTINQPGSILFDTAFLKTLPDTEWSNGFAEIIKYACLFDAALFEELSKHDIEYYKKDEQALCELIKICVAWKTSVVAEDEKEQDKRKLLNYGHTAGHAIETLYGLPHGQAVAIGMMIACSIAEGQLHTSKKTRKQLSSVLKQFGLPAAYDMNIKKVMGVLRMDKKRNSTGIDYILLKNIGEAIITLLPFDTIEKALASANNGSDH